MMPFYTIRAISYTGEAVELFPPILTLGEVQEVLGSFAHIHAYCKFESVVTPFWSLDLGVSEKFSRAGYDPELCKLLVEYPPRKDADFGTVYIYHDVPQMIVDALLEVRQKGESVGSALYHLVEPDKKTKVKKYEFTIILPR